MGCHFLLHKGVEIGTNIMIIQVEIDVSFMASLVTQTVNNLPAMQETQIRSLGQEDPLEKGMATHSSVLTWRIP